MSLFQKIRKNAVVALSDLQSHLLTGMQADDIETLAGHVVQRHGWRCDSPYYVFSRSYAAKTTAIPNMFEKNGEKALLDALLPLGLSTLFDVGANRGVWSRHALSVFPDAQLHAFEIVPETFAILSRNISGNNNNILAGRNKNIILNCFGLSNTTETVEVTLFDSNLLSTIVPHNDDGDRRKIIRCEVMNGAEYCRDRNVCRIDFLKIDVEGAEGLVLQGMEDMISSGAVRIIQFEYNRGAICGRFLLKDAYDFFGKHGFVLGKLTPSGVHFHDYQFLHEDFLGPNYVACHSDDEKVLAHIQEFR